MLTVRGQVSRSSGATTTCASAAARSASAIARFIAEAYLDGSWYVIDATRLSDRRSLVRIATGRDAADCAFLSYHGGYVGLQRMRVDAVVVPSDAEDVTALDAAAAAATEVRDRHDGIVPADLAGLLDLPGVGPMEMSGRTMGGFVRADETAHDDPDTLSRLTALAAAATLSLPPK